MSQNSRAGRTHGSHENWNQDLGNQNPQEFSLFVQDHMVSCFFFLCIETYGSVMDLEDIMVPFNLKARC